MICFLSLLRWANDSICGTVKERDIIYHTTFPPSEQQNAHRSKDLRIRTDRRNMGRPQKESSEHSEGTVTEHQEEMPELTYFQTGNVML